MSQCFVERGVTMNKMLSISIFSTLLFSCSSDFSEGLARVAVGDKSGYINKAGEVAITPQFDSAGRF